MPQSRGQLLVYLAVGAVLVLVGLNSIKGDKSESAVLDAGPGSASHASGEGSGFAVSAGSRKLTVDVTGAVRRPGVYRFKQGDRVIDAILRAGGSTRSAMLGAINRAATLTDGQQVVVPSRTARTGAGPALTPGAAGTPVSLGTATREQLEEIDGIGPVTAGKIIAFRDSKGGLGSIEELDQISGIGPVTMESLRDALAP